jgi:hypothetical protein
MSNRTQRLRQPLIEAMEKLKEFDEKAVHQTGSQDDRKIRVQKRLVAKLLEREIKSIKTFQF